MTSARGPARPLAAPPARSPARPLARSPEVSRRTSYELVVMATGTDDLLWDVIRGEAYRAQNV